MVKYVASAIGGLLLFVGIAFGAHQLVNTTPRDDAATVVMVKANGGHGTGFYIGNNEFITAGHVASMAQDGKMSLVSERDRDNPTEAVVVWTDKTRDVALLRVDPTVHTVTLPAVKLSCEQPREFPVGTEVHSIGYPLGLGLIEVWGDVSSPTHKDYGAVPQFTANVSIAPGNSGGPLFDNQGYIVGMADSLPLLPMPFGVLSFPTLSQFVPRSEICAAIADHTPTVQASK